MRSLVARLPEDLERLELRFRWCSVGIDGASILAEKLPSALLDKGGVTQVTQSSDLACGPLHDSM